jgi:hypothetical protein
VKITPFDSAKALATIVYLASQLPERRNLYKVLKAIYRADKQHLHRYGRQIFQETYSALPLGTVPSYAYDVVKHVRDGKWRAKMPKQVKQYISVSADDTITALRGPDLGVLSSSDIECLDEAIAFFAPMTFDEVKDNSHEDAAYNATPLNKRIPLETIILKAVPDGEALLDYLKSA